MQTSKKMSLRWRDNANRSSGNPAMTSETHATLSAAGRLMLTIAISDYDHVRDFASGVVRADGIEANFLTLSTEKIFFALPNFPDGKVPRMPMGKSVALRPQNAS